MSDPGMNANLQLRFPNRRPADYWIFFLDPEYRVAGVSNADGSALWVFSRRRAIDEKLLQSVLDEAKEQGVDIARATYTGQSGCEGERR